MKFDVRGFFENLSRKFKFHKNLTRIKGTLHENQNHCLSYLAHFFLEWEMFQTKVVEKIKTHMLRSVTFSKIVPFMRKCGKILQSGAGHRWQYGACALHAGYLRLQIHTHSDSVILIALPLQQWSHESASMLRYAYIASLVLLGYGLKHSSSIPYADHRGFGF